MSTAILVNIFVVLCLTALSWLFGGNGIDDRNYFARSVFVWLLILSFVGWVWTASVITIIHFT